MTSMFAALGVALLVGSLLVGAVAWFMPAPVQEARPPSRVERVIAGVAARLDRRMQIMLGVAAGAGLVLALLTGVVLYLLLLPAAVVLGRLVLGPQGHTEQTDRLQQMEAWVRSLSGMIVTGTSLETALSNSLPNAGSLIRSDIERLVARINAGWSTHRALGMLADEWDDQVGDLTVMHLSLAASQRGEGLSKALDDLAESVAHQVSVRRKVAADRAAPSRQAKIVSSAVLGLLLLIPLLGGPFEAYRSALGQVLYGCLAAISLALLVWMRNSVAPQLQPRMMENTQVVVGS